MPVACIVPTYPITYEYTTPDGTVYPLDVPRMRTVLNSEGEGLPPINYIDQRGPFQHGKTFLDYFLQPRIVQLTVRHWYDDRVSLDAARQGLVGILNPGLQPLPTSLYSGTLTKQLSDGARRSLKCFILQGPNFNPRGTGWDEFAFTEVLRFQADDPLWYDPHVRTHSFDYTARTQLVGPITGPIQSSDLTLTNSFTYAGTWLSYPIFTITGPVSGITITNETTGERIVLAYEVPDGVVATIDLTSGAKAVSLDDGTNLLGYITDDSDLVTWALVPANGGVNDVHVYASGTNANTQIVMSWYDMYLGI